MYVYCLYHSRKQLYLAGRLKVSYYSNGTPLVKMAGFQDLPANLYGIRHDSTISNKKKNIQKPWNLQPQAFLIYPNHATMGTEPSSQVGLCRISSGLGMDQSSLGQVPRDLSKAMMEKS
jgi:hypothetical protein